MSKTFMLFDKNIEIDETQRNLAYMQNQRSIITSRCLKIFNAGYDKLTSSYSTWINGVATLVRNCAQGMAEDFLSILKDQKIYTYTADDILSSWDSLYASEVLESMDNDINKVIDQANAEREYREERKANRGRMEGWGFGMGNAIKAGIEAGAFNMMTGAAHSVANSIGNAGTSAAESSEIRKIIQNDTNIRKLKLTFGYAGLDMMQKTISIIERESDIVFDRISQSDSDKSNALISNMNGIPKTEQPELYIQAIMLDYLNESAYISVIENYPDEIYNVDKIATYLYIDVSEPIVKAENSKLTDIENMYQSYINMSFYPYDDLKDMLDIYDDVQNDIRKTEWSEDTVNDRIPRFRHIKTDIKNICSVFYGDSMSDREDLFDCAWDLQEFFKNEKSKDLNNEEVLIDERIHADKYQHLNVYHPQILDNAFAQLKRIQNVENIRSILNDLVSDKFKSLAKCVFIPGITAGYDKRETKLRKYSQAIPQEDIITIIHLHMAQGIAVTTKRIIVYNHLLASDCVDVTLDKVRKVMISADSVDIQNVNMKSAHIYSMETFDDAGACADLNNFVNDAFLMAMIYGRDLPLPVEHLKFYKNSEEEMDCLQEDNPKETIVSSEFTGNANENMMFCTSCGKRIPRGSKFCRYCGSKVTYMK